MSEQEWSDTQDLGPDGAAVEQQADPAWEAIQEKAATLVKPATAGSLRDRMRKRTEELEQRTSDLFPVPRYDAFAAVELRVIPWTKSEELVTKNQRIAKFAMQNTAGDEIVAATVGFHEIKEDGDLEPITDAHSWFEMATKLGGKKLPEGCGERVALLALCGDQGVIALNAEYRRWLGGADTGLRSVQSELKRDF